MRPHRPRRRAALALLVVAAAAACSDPDPSDAGATDAPTVAATETDPATEDLRAELAELRASVTTARELLEAARRDADTDAAAGAVAALTADDRLTEGATVATAPLFPGPESSREETIDYGDTLTRTLTAARGASGPLGAEVSRLLGDAVAGDLGIWQRDARGLLDAVDDAARAPSVEAAEEAVLELPGEGTRALAYALLAARADDPDDVTAYAERGVAHLDVILRAVDDATTTEPDGP